LPVSHRHRRRKSPLFILLGILAILAAVFWSQMINWMLPADSRPGTIVFSTESLTQDGFESAAAALEATPRGSAGEFKHVDLFRRAGILTFEGPATCLGCHQQVTYQDDEGNEKSEDLMTNLTSSAHYRLFTRDHPNVYGFNGELADNFPMGKLNRPCPKPGSFAMTAWAELVVTEAGDTLSAGCGQCHFGGQYQAPLGEMMPLYRTGGKERTRSTA